MRTRTNMLAALLAGVAWIGGASHARADLIVNGGFESGDFAPGWSVTGNTTDQVFGVDASMPHTGTYGAFFGQVGSEAFLMQTVTTVPGLEYILDFYVMNEDGSSPNEFSATFGSSTLLDESNLPTFGYQEYTFRILATAVATVVTFGFRNDNSFFDFDDVSLRAVPEPRSLLCLAIGAVLVARYGWRRCSG
jgi:hypothetical protein